MQRPQGILAVRITFDYSVEYEHCCMDCAWQHQIGKSSTSEDTHSSSCATKVSSLPYRNRKKHHHSCQRLRLGSINFLFHQGDRRGLKPAFT